MAAHSQRLPTLQRQPARQLRHTQDFSNRALLNSSRPLNRPSVRNLRAPLHLPHPVRFVQQSTYAMSRGGGRGTAD